MTTTTQLSLLGPYDASKPAPGFSATIKPGDVLTNHKHERAIVRVVSDNLDGAVFVVDLCNEDRTAVWLQREILAHSVRS